MRMISLGVASLKDGETVMPEFEALGRRHRGYKLKPSHYEQFGRTLMWTLGQVLGSDFNPDVRRAWEAWYEIVAQTMAAASAKPN